jgi:hypothetical protein
LKINWCLLKYLEMMMMLEVVTAEILLEEEEVKAVDSA